MSAIIDPRDRPTVTVVIIVFAHVRPHFSKSKKKQISSENNAHYWRGCGSVQVDH